MRLCSREFNIGVKVENSGSCGSCALNKRVGRPEKEHFSVADVVPHDLCPFAYFSIIPYWLSFKQGTWFRWRENKSDVVCQCPKSNGVVFLVKKVDGNEIAAEIESIGKCPYNYSVGQVFKIESLSLCPALFPSLFAGINGKNVPSEIELGCSIFPVSVFIRINTEIQEEGS